MVQLVQDDANNNVGGLKVALVYSDNEELLSMLSQQLERIKNLYLEYTSKVGGIITSHAGPGTIGVSYYPVV
jgi:fatty acid-binding protein DegV